MQSLGMDPMPMLRVAGTHRQMGQQIGEAMRPQIQHSVENARRLIGDSYEKLSLTWESAIIQARKYSPFTQEQYPQYFEELQGIAEGANVDLNEVIVVNTMEGVTLDALHLQKCTSMALTQERTSAGDVLIAHNEDWLPDDYPDVYLIHATPEKEPPFLAMTYGALLPNIGFNADGIAQCCDSVYPNDARIGLPRVVASRAVLAARTPGDALRAALVHHRAAGYNHLIAHESGELYNVEVSARQFAILPPQRGAMVHTNHYLDARMQAIENQPDELINTRVRYQRAWRLLNQTNLHSLETLQAIQRDHVNYPDSICRHAIDADNPLDREKTICALIINLSARRLHIAWGNPCESVYHAYDLDA
ncbi:MAG: hypothetical protein OHK0052_06570 [Anaerolineales bacterium]